MDPQLIYITISGVFIVLWWLLRNKDAAQQEQIKVLFAKHDEDAKHLQDLRLAIAEGHYKKVELDTKFDKLEYAFKMGFQDLGHRFDKLAEVLIDRTKEHP